LFCRERLVFFCEVVLVSVGFVVFVFFFDVELDVGGGVLGVSFFFVVGVLFVMVGV